MNNHKSVTHKKKIVIMVSREMEELPNMKPTTNDSIDKKVDDVEKLTTISKRDTKLMVFTVRHRDVS